MKKTDPQEVSAEEVKNAYRATLQRSKEQSQNYYNKAVMTLSGGDFGTVSPTFSNLFLLTEAYRWYNLLLSLVRVSFLRIFYVVR